jgi:hypothetical protein
MTFSTSNTLAALASLAVTALTLVVSATPAFAGAPAYRLVPVTAAKASTVVARDVLWRCGPDGCTAGSATSRPAVVCATAVREVGAISSFTANGKDFSTEELAACNAKAR